MEFTCRVCGMQYDKPTWENDQSASHDICVCCDVEFGFEDITLAGIRKYRAEWIQNGTRFQHPEYMPAAWNPELQMRNIPDKWN